jgi:hypothetical protein
MKAPAIARKLKRSTGAVYARINSLKRARSTFVTDGTSEQAAFFHAQPSSNTAAPRHEE